VTLVDREIAVLDVFIIDELRRREREQREDAERPRLELPLDNGQPPPGSGGPEADDDIGDDRHDDSGNGNQRDDGSKRGVVIIQL